MNEGKRGPVFLLRLVNFLFPLMSPSAMLILKVIKVERWDWAERHGTFQGVEGCLHLQLASPFGLIAMGFLEEAGGGA